MSGMADVDPKAIILETLGAPLELEKPQTLAEPKVRRGSSPAAAQTDLRAQSPASSAA